MYAIRSYYVRRMYGDNPENVYYYLTTLNENYTHPAMPEGAEEGIRKGIYKLETLAGDKAQVQLLGCGSILNYVRRAAVILSEEYGIGSDVFSVTSFNELAREGQDADRWNLLHPSATPRVPYIAQVMGFGQDPRVSPALPSPARPSHGCATRNGRHSPHSLSPWAAHRPHRDIRQMFPKTMSYNFV